MQWTKPKSVRQIGDIPGKGRIYMEDYVIRFARKLAGQSQGGEKAAVLLGNRYLYNGDKIYQISGIVEIPNFAGRSGPELSAAVWDRIYSEIKENFTDLEIVGWFYSCRGFSIRQAGQLLEMHKRNFQHRDKVLYLYEEMGKEDGFFLYRSGQFERQKGYYIYYEKNPEMRHYMMEEANRIVHIVEQEDDRVLRNIRGVLKENEEKKKKKESGERKSYGLVAVVLLLGVLLGAAAWNNKNSLSRLNEQLHGIQKEIQKEFHKDTIMETIGNGVVTPQAVNTPMSTTPAAVSEITPAGISGN